MIKGTRNPHRDVSDPDGAVGPVIEQTFTPMITPLASDLAMVHSQHPDAPARDVYLVNLDTGEALDIEISEERGRSVLQRAASQVARGNFKKALRTLRGDDDDGSGGETAELSVHIGNRGWMYGRYRQDGVGVTEFTIGPSGSKIPSGHNDVEFDSIRYVSN